MKLLTKRKLVTVLLATVGVMGVLAASFFAPMHAAPAAKKPVAKKISFLENDIGDVASLLHIEKRMCEIELRSENSITQIGVDIEVYKDGQKQRTNWSLPRFNVNNYGVVKPSFNRVQVALFAADLDYLPLAGAINRHHRVQVKMAIPGSSSEASIDVPKELFDFSHVSTSGRFRLEAGSATEVPLFWMLSMPAVTHTVTGPDDSVSEFIEKNSKGNLLIVYLRVQKQ